MTVSLTKPDAGTVGWTDAINQNWTDLETRLTEYSCRLYKSSTQSAAEGDTIVSWDSEAFDHGDLHSTTTNTSRITFPVAGRFLVLGRIRIDNSTHTNNDLRVALLKNGSSLGDSTRIRNQQNSSYETVLPFVELLDVAANDYVEVQFTQYSNGATRTIESGATGSIFAAVLVAR